jgi:hypothetical protein
MKIFTFLFVCMLAMILVGCPSPNLDIKVVDNRVENLCLEIAVNDDFLKTDSSASISAIYFYKIYGEANELVPLWSLVSNDTKGAKLHKITYAITPEGFRSKSTPKDILSGDKLRVYFYSRVSEIDTELGSIEFLASK